MGLFEKMMGTRGLSRAMGTTDEEVEHAARISPREAELRAELAEDDVEQGSGPRRLALLFAA